LAAGGAQISFRNTPGLIFQVLANTDLAASQTNWVNLGSAVEDSPGRYQFNDTTTGTEHRFYAVGVPSSATQD
jgi:hypothetical protein